MRVLVTNDDGLHAPGLAAMASTMLEAGHEVVAIAPEGDRSGSGGAVGNLSDGSYLRYRSMPLAGLEAVESYELDGPPALCVLAASLGAFGPPPTIVASGVNPGLNTGRLTLHSGTVGAALTAANVGMSAVAASIEGHEASVKHFDVAAQLAAEVVDWLVGQPAPSVVNLSLPDHAHDELLAPRFGTLAAFGTVRAEVISRSEERIQLGFRPTDAVVDPDSDSALVRAGHVVVTSLTGITGSEPVGLSDVLAADDVVS